VTWLAGVALQAVHDIWQNLRLCAKRGILQPPRTEAWCDALYGVMFDVLYGVMCDLTCVVACIVMCDVTCGVMCDLRCDVACDVAYGVTPRDV